MMNTLLEAAIRALSKAKTQRAEAASQLPEAAIHASADLLDVDVCVAHVAALEQARPAAIAANKPDAVIDIDGKLLRARIAVEIAVAKSSTSTAKHTAAVAADIAAKAAVTQAARAVIDSESIDMAAEFTTALDAAFRIGARLQALSLRDGRPTSMGAVSMPAAVEQALKRLPPPDPLNTPVHILRGAASSTAWADRMAELTADDVIDVDVAA
jgi:hypothetical protein